jgi:hypothetical protein
LVCATAVSTSRSHRLRPDVGQQPLAPLGRQLGTLDIANPPAAPLLELPQGDDLVVDPQHDAVDIRSRGASQGRGQRQHEPDAADAARAGKLESHRDKDLGS